MHLPETRERLDSISGKLDSLMSKHKGVPTTWVERIRTAKEAVETARAALGEGKEKLDYNSVLDAITGTFDGLNELTKDHEGVPAQWQSHVNIMLSDLCVIMAFLNRCR